MMDLNASHHWHCMSLGEVSCHGKEEAKAVLTLSCVDGTVLCSAYHALRKSSTVPNWPDSQEKGTSSFVPQSFHSRRPCSSPSTLLLPPASHRTPRLTKLKQGSGSVVFFKEDELKGPQNRHNLAHPWFEIVHGEPVSLAATIVMFFLRFHEGGSASIHPFF